MKQTTRLLPLIALCFAVIAVFAFKPNHKEGNATHAAFFWYLLTPGGNKNNPGDYMQVSMKPSCDPGSKVCAVHAQDDGSGHPLGIPASGAVVTNTFIDQVDHRATN